MSTGVTTFAVDNTRVGKDFAESTIVRLYCSDNTRIGKCPASTTLIQLTDSALVRISRRLIESTSICFYGSLSAIHTSQYYIKFDGNLTLGYQNYSLRLAFEDKSIKLVYRDSNTNF